MFISRMNVNEKYAAKYHKIRDFEHVIFFG